MELPIISTPREQDPEVIVRAIKRANSDACALSSEQTELTGATAYHNRDLADIWDANGVYDLRVPEEAAPEAVFEEIRRHFDAVGATCYRCVPNDVTLDERLEALVLEAGCRRESVLVLRLEEAALSEAGRDDLQILSARDLRAGYRDFIRLLHRHEWSAESADRMARFQLNALDDPQLDMFLARRDGEVVASAGAYAAGEIGLIREVATHPAHRRRGVMRTLLSRVLEHGARSQFKSIALETDADNESAIAFYESFGFRRLIEFPVYACTPRRSERAAGGRTNPC